jgi:hypothetical protein
MFSLTPILGGFQEVDSLVTVAFDPVRLVGADSRRAILYFTNADQQQLNLWHNPTVPILTNPNFIVPAFSTLRFTWAFDGPLSTWAWLGSYANITNDVYCLQILWLPEQLAGAPG